MRVARRSFLASAASSLALPAIVRSARADAPPIALKLHHSFSAVSSVHDKFLVPWARKVEADANGRIRIDIFPSMQLGGAPAHLFDQVRAGDADIVWGVPSLTPGRFPKIETFELPFLPSRRALVSSRALQDFAALYLKEEFADVQPLAFSCSDRGVIHANTPVRSVEDIKEMKLHVQTALAGEALRALGADPVPMPSGQLPVAISEGVVDGCLDPWHMVPPLRLNDLLKTHTEFSDVSLSSRTYVLAMNKDVYDRLPRELKATLDSNSGAPAAGMAGTMWDIQANTVADSVAERGDIIVTLLPEAVAHWRKQTDPVVNAWLKDMKEKKIDGGRMLGSAHQLLAKYASLPEPQPPQPPPPEQEVTSQPQPQPAPPAQRPQAEVTPAPKVAPPKVAPPTPSPKLAPAAAPPTPVAKPAPPPAAHPPAVAAKPAAPAIQPPPVAAGPAPAHVAKPAPPPPHVATQAPAAAPAPPAAPAPSPAPVAKPIVPKPPPQAPAPAPKHLDIPL